MRNLLIVLMIVNACKCSLQSPRLKRISSLSFKFCPFVFHSVADIGDALMDDLNGDLDLVVLDYISSFLSFGVNFVATSMITLAAW